jgi:hypothetical protein
MEAIASFLRFRMLQMLQMLQGVKSYSIKFYLKPIIYCIFIAKVCRWIFQSNLNLVCFGECYRIPTYQFRFDLPLERENIAFQSILDKFRYNYLPVVLCLEEYSSSSLISDGLQLKTRRKTEMYEEVLIMGDDFFFSKQKRCQYTTPEKRVRSICFPKVVTLLHKIYKHHSQ